MLLDLPLPLLLEQTKYFTKGCRDFVVVTEHKKLVNIFGDRTVNEIQNTCIFRIKQLPWLFEVHYMTGKTNLAADDVSSYPTLNT